MFKRGLISAILCLLMLPAPAFAQGTTIGLPFNGGGWDGISDQEILDRDFDEYSFCELLDAYNDIDDDLEDHFEHFDGSAEHIEKLNAMLANLEDELDERSFSYHRIPCGLYGVVQIGGDFSALNAYSSESLLGDLHPNESIGTGYTAGLGLGATFYRGVDAEASFAYHGALGTNFMPDDSLRIKGDASAYTFLANIKLYPYELLPATRPYTSFPGTKEFPRISFYVEGGGGFSVNTLDNVGLSTGSTLSGNTTVSGAYDVGAGLKFDFSSLGYSRTFANIGYRYTSLGEFKSGNTLMTGDTPSAVTPLKTDASLHELLFQVGYKF